MFGKAPAKESAMMPPYTSCPVGLKAVQQTEELVKDAMEEFVKDVRGLGEKAKASGYKDIQEEAKKIEESAKKILENAKKNILEVKKNVVEIKKVREDSGAGKKARKIKKRDAESDNDDERETKKMKKETDEHGERETRIKKETDEHDERVDYENPRAQPISQIDAVIDERSAQPRTRQGELPMEPQTTVWPYTLGIRAAASEVIKRIFG
ncbi:hypothetical protein LX36DRAFT_729187 [Colletotrichum falcatum]|nr:hypothetical protein LX36DRAFT_729187 [Colletotrichum falcatum]